MKCIMVADENWKIGKNNGLLVHIPGDLKYFKEKTLGKTIVIGRKTLESLPGGKPLKGRTTIVLSRSMGNVESAEDAPVVIARDMESLMEILKEKKATEGLDLNEVFVAGGEAVYKLLFPYCREFFITRIHESFDGDREFFDLDEFVKRGEMEVTWESPVHEENNVKYHFMKYERTGLDYEKEIRK